MRNRAALFRQARRQSLRSLLSRIRTQEPDLTADTDETLLSVFIARALDRLLLEEANFAKRLSGAADPPQPDPLLQEALRLTARLSLVTYALSGMKAEAWRSAAQNEVEDLLAEIDKLQASLNQAYESIDRYRARELQIQQLLDESGIGVEVIDRMSTDIARRSIELRNRLN